REVEINATIVVKFNVIYPTCERTIRRLRGGLVRITKDNCACSRFRRAVHNEISPIVIHPDFKDRIWVAVQQRLHDDGEMSKSKLKRWYEFCHHSFASDGSGA